MRLESNLLMNIAFYCNVKKQHSMWFGGRGCGPTFMY